MMNLRPHALALLTPTLLAVASTHAGVTDFRIDYGSALGSDGATYTTNDLFIDFTGRYTGSQVLVTLDAGTIHQETFAGSGFDVAPTAALLGHVPTLTADTYFTQGGAAGQLAYGNPNMVGGPVNLDPSQSSSVQSPTQLAHAWAPAPGADIEDQTGFHTLRLSLSADARGSFQYLASADSELFYTNAGNRPGTAPLYAIEAGKVVALDNVPEPEPEPEPAHHRPVYNLYDFRQPRDVVTPTGVIDPDFVQFRLDSLTSSWTDSLFWLTPSPDLEPRRSALINPLFNWEYDYSHVIPIPLARKPLWDNTIYADGHLAAPQAFTLTPEPGVLGLPALLLLAARRHR